MENADLMRQRKEITEYNINKIHSIDQANSKRDLKK